MLVVGSVAFDAVETPFGKREKMLGGSATHFSLSASFFSDVRVFNTSHSATLTITAPSCSSPPTRTPGS